MRILLLDHCQYITGAFVKTIEVAEALAQYGHEVTLVASSKTKLFSFECFSKKDVEYVLAPSLLWGHFRNGADLWDAFQRIAILKNRNFDLVHALSCRPTVIFPALYFKCRYKVPLIQEWDDLFSKEGSIGERSGMVYQFTLGYVEAMFDTYFRKYADTHIVVSSYLKDKLRNMGIPASRILENFHYGSKYVDMKPLSIKEARHKANISTDKFIIAYAGSIHPRDAAFFYRVLKELPSKIKNKLELLIINTQLPFDLKDVGIKVLKFPRLSDNDFYIRLSAANAFILPYLLTVANLARWPSKFTDYCSVGRPIISTPVGDLPALYKEQRVGILTKEDSVSALTNGICELVENPYRASEMGKRARAYANREFRLSALAERLDTFYRKTIFKCNKYS